MHSPPNAQAAKIQAAGNAKKINRKKNKHISILESNFIGKVRSSRMLGNEVNKAMPRNPRTYCEKNSVGAGNAMAIPNMTKGRMQAVIIVRFFLFANFIGFFSLTEKSLRPDILYGHLHCQRCRPVCLPSILYRHAGYRRGQRCLRPHGHCGR